MIPVYIKHRPVLAGTVHSMLEHIAHTETVLEELIVLHQVAKDTVQADAMHAAAG